MIKVHKSVRELADRYSTQYPMLKDAINSIAESYFLAVDTQGCNATLALIELERAILSKVADLISEALANALFTIELDEPFDSNLMFNYISPDCFTIYHENFKSVREAYEYLQEWIKGFEAQGYYSTRGYRMPISELYAHCTLCAMYEEPEEDEEDDNEEYNAF